MKYFQANTRSYLSWLSCCCSLTLIFSPYFRASWLFANNNFPFTFPWLFEAKMLTCSLSPPHPVCSHICWRCVLLCSAVGKCAWVCARHAALQLPGSLKQQGSQGIYFERADHPIFTAVSRLWVRWRQRRTWAPRRGTPVNTRGGNSGPQVRRVKQTDP